MDDLIVSPFFHRLHFRKIDYLKILFGTIVLFPFRVVWTLLLFILASMMARFSNHLLEKWNLNKTEETEWRNFFKTPVMFTLRVMFFVTGFHRVKVIDKGGPNDENEARILVLAPHTSPFDILSGIKLNAPSVVSRHDAVDIPFFGNILKLTAPVFVQRDSQSSRQNVLNNVLETIKYLRIVFFPEGTCSNRKALVSFKSGAFKPGLPVQPIALKYDQFGGPDTLSWTWDGPSALLCIWLTLCRWSTGFTIIKLPVYYPSEEEKLDPDLYALNVSKLLSTELNLPKLKFSFDDVKYLRNRVFRSPVCLKFLKLCDKVSSFVKLSNELNKDSKPISTTNEESKQLTKESIKSDKIQLFINTLENIIDETLEKIEFSSPKQISSVNDLISIMNLEKYPDLYSSYTIKEFYECLKISTVEPNTTHLAVILNLCDLRVNSFWQRLQNSFHALRDSPIDEDIKQISLHSFKSLLWLALGLEIDEQILINQFSLSTKPITMDITRYVLLEHLRSCVEANARELLEEETD